MRPTPAPARYLGLLPAAVLEHATDRRTDHALRHRVEAAVPELTDAEIEQALSFPPEVETGGPCVVCGQITHHGCGNCKAEWVCSRCWIAVECCAMAGVLRW